MNVIRTAMLLALMTALFMGVGYLIGGEGGMLIAFLIAAAMNLFSYWNADKIVLRMYKAQPVDETHPNAVVRHYVADVKAVYKATAKDEENRLLGVARITIGKY